MRVEICLPDRRTLYLTIFNNSQTNVIIIENMVKNIQKSFVA